MARSTRSMIQRNKLMRLLDGISEEQILYICAPAGYGKTVAIKQWLERGGCNHALLSLSEFDNDPAHFCGRFCDALIHCQPKNKRLRAIAEHQGFDGAPDVFTARAVSVLSKGDKVRLAIDDLHFIHEEKALKLILNFLKGLPECFQIALISRGELPLCFSELLLKGNIAKVSADKLKFGSDEIISLYENRGFSITPEKAAEIQQYTGGWAIGLGALLLSGSEPHDGSLEYLDEFIKTNVWQRWDESEREFMLKSAVVTEMTPAICTALTGMTDSDKLLEHLIRQNMFISRTARGVYQYHHLFRDFLLNELARCGEESTRDLLRTAGYSYLEAQDFHNAMDCFIKCENHKGIEQCYILLLTNGKEYFYIEKMISMAGLPLLQKVAEKYPYIYSHLVWTAYIKGLADEMARYADLYYSKQSEIIQLAPQFALNIILVLLVDFRQSLSGLLQTAGSVLINKESDASASFSTINQNFPLLHRGTRDFSELALGNLDVNITHTKDALYGLFGEQAVLLAECLSAGLLYEQGHLDRAHSHALTVNAIVVPGFPPEIRFFTMAVMIIILDSLNQNKQADNLQNAMSDIIENENAHYLKFNFNALKTRRLLSHGDMDAARAWLDENAVPLHNRLDFYRLYGHITTCRAYITVGDYDSAVILLEKALKLAEAYNRPLDIIETRILLSIALWKKKDSFQTQAIHHLEQALSLANGYGFTQLFVNDGAEISGMLLRIKRRAEQSLGENPPPSGFVKMLYLNTQNSPDTGMTSNQTEIPEQLKFTAKQKSVMKLLTEGKSYREISDALGITRPTLRSHLTVIYKKLGVTDGTEAIKRINAGGILNAD